MKNPIKDNRLVKDTTFATRFLKFVEDVEVNDACSEDEKGAMISYAESLIKYQVRTAKNKDEIDYLKRVGMWGKYQEETFVTKDGYTILIDFFEDSDDCLYSCMKEPTVGDSVYILPIRKIGYKKHRIKNNRHYFLIKKNCEQYIEYHKPKYSEAHVKELELKCIKLKSKI